MLCNKPKAVQFLRFCTVGLGNTAVDFAAFFILNLAGAPYLLAQTLSYAAGVANSFYLNRKWTFRVISKANVREAARFVMVNGFSLLVSAALLASLYDANHLDLWLSKFAATAGGIVVNYTGSRLWVFKESAWRRHGTPPDGYRQ